MKILDCESFDSTLVSLSDIFGIQKEILLEFLRSIDYFNSDSRFIIPVDDYLYAELRKAHRINTDYNRVCWFHLSRTLNIDSFKEGIKPLNLVIKDIWNGLYALVQDSISKEEWGKIRSECFRKTKDDHSVYLYSMKTTNKMHWGPYAMLIRNVAFDSDELSNHDYLEIPEIVEDICRIICSYNGLDLSVLFLNTAKSIIVKFFDENTDIYYIKIALTYLYYSAKEYGFSTETNTCYDGEGIVVPYERITKIEIIDY